MESFVFNSFKERLMSGEVSGKDTWKFQPVNKNFTEDYADTLKYIRCENDLYYLNKDFSVSSYNDIVTNFSGIYYPNIHPVLYNYTKMQEVDIAHEPEYVNEENFDLFIENNSREIKDKADHRSLYHLFFDSNSDFYRIDHTEERINKDTGELETVKVARGFYYIKTKEDLKWCADKVNGENYNNKINIVLGDNIGTDIIPDSDDKPITINYSLGENPEQPYEGILYGNGYSFKNININCNNSCNGIVAYLGNEGWIDTITIEGSENTLTCKKQISITHLMNGDCDVVAGFLCGKNNGKIKNVVLNGDLKLKSFYPKIYSVYNKIDDADTEETNLYANMFYPDYLCVDSLGNIIPYVGYFNEGVFATMSGYNKNTGEIETYWKTNVNTYDGKGFSIKHADQEEKIPSPNAWQYVDGFQPSANGMYIASTNRLEDRKNILFYDTFIASQTNKLEDPGVKFTIAASTMGLLPINTEYHIQYPNNPIDGKIYNVRKKVRTVNRFGELENAPYLDKSIKLNQQNRAAYFISPIVGINNSEINTVFVNSNIITPGTFVGFIGGLVGKQLNGSIKKCMVNISASDSATNVPVKLDIDNNKCCYHLRDYYKQRIAEQDEKTNEVFSFALPSIKNIGGLFGECIVMGEYESLVVSDVTAFFDNKHVKVCKEDNNTRKDTSFVPEDYYLLNKFAGITPIIELNTSNICDIWNHYNPFNDPSLKLIEFKNLNITYNESLSEDDLRNKEQLKNIDLYFKQVFNSYHNNAARCQYPVASAEDIYNNPDDYNDTYLAYPTIDGAASPLVCELKPIYQLSPSIIQTLFANSPFKNYSAYSADYTEKTYKNAYNKNSSGFECNSALIIENTYDSNIVKVDNVGLYSMDQNLASPLSNPEFYGINLMTDLPGIQNPVSAHLSATIFDRFFSEDRANYSYDIRKVFGKLIKWENCLVSNNHDVWTHPDHASNLNTEYFTDNNLFKYTVVPKAAQLPKYFSAYYEDFYGPHVYTATHAEYWDPSNSGMKIGHYVVPSGYNGNKIPYTYSYFGSDFKIKKENDIIYNDMITNISGYRVYLENPNYGRTYTADGQGDGWPDVVMGDFITGFIIEVLIDETNNTYDYKATACYEHGHGPWVSPSDPDYDPSKALSPGGMYNEQFPEMKYETNICSDGKLVLTASVDERNKYISIDDTSAVNDWLYVNGGLYVCDYNYGFGGRGIGHYMQHIIQIDPDTFYNKKPLENMEFTQTLICTRTRDGRREILYAGENKLGTQKVDTINKLDETTRYITGYDLDELGAITGIRSSTTPPGLVSAYMLEKNYTKIGNINNTVYPADQQGDYLLDSWTAAALTAVSMPVLSAYSREELYSAADYLNINEIPSRLYYKVGDNNKPGGASNTSAIWSAASGIIKYADDTEVTALLGLTEGFYLTAQADIETQIASLPKDQRVFNYVPVGSNWKYLEAPKAIIDPVLPKLWFEQNKVGKYYVDYLGSTYDDLAATGLIYQDARPNLSFAEKAIFSANIIPKHVSANKFNPDTEYADYFKYTYTKGELGINIGKSGISMPVEYNVANDKAGFWFNMGETTDSAFNDELHYTSNVFAIGKTPNQRCILDVLKVGTSAVSFSGIMADDFDGLYVTDSDNKPVMYIDVGLGECSDGTSWSLSSYPSSDDVSASGLILEVET